MMASAEEIAAALEAWNGAEGNDRSAIRAALEAAERVRAEEQPQVTSAALAAAGKALAVEFHGEGADQQDADYYARHLKPALDAAYMVTGAPEIQRGQRVLRLTSMEYGALSEAVRYSQEAHAENGDDRLNPTLSRIQRKLGEEPSA